MNRRSFLAHLGGAAASVPLLSAARADEKSPALTSPPFISRLQPAVVGGGFELPDHRVLVRRADPRRGRQLPSLRLAHSRTGALPPALALHVGDRARRVPNAPSAPTNSPRSPSLPAAAISSTAAPRTIRTSAKSATPTSSSTWARPTTARRPPTTIRRSGAPRVTSPRGPANGSVSPPARASKARGSGSTPPLLEPRRRVGFHRHDQPVLCPCRRPVPPRLQIAQRKSRQPPGRRRPRPHYTGPWTRQPTPWMFKGKPAHVEDPFLWYENGRVNALMKDVTGDIAAKNSAASTSPAPMVSTGTTTAPPSHTVADCRWSDRSHHAPGFPRAPATPHRKRPRPRTSSAPPPKARASTWKDATRTWNTVIPLAKPS